LDYFTIKHIHVTSLAASYTLFFIRGVWMMRASPMLARTWVRVVPHVIDTILLASAIVLVVMLRQYPFVAGWLTAKVLGLIAYILIGTVALKRGKTKAVRVSAWLAAQAVFFYIVSVALTKNPLGAFASL
jgi:uncharacterized membrane protein SirB2